MMKYKVWVFVTVQNTFMRGASLEPFWMGVCGYDCLEHIYGWVCVGVIV